LSDIARQLAEIFDLCFADPSNETSLRGFDDVFRPRVIAVLVSLYRKDRSFIEDAYQSAFVKYLEIFRDGRRPGIAYDSYFVAIAKNALIDELRRHQKEVGLDVFLSSQGGYEPSEIGAAEAGVAFFEALGKLDRRCQFIIESHLVNGIPAEDIAKSLKVQPQSIPALLSRCREMLRAYLRK
jgi:RNA polymerase sigma factor (sigma-70 family)